jgi:hypothetical protein
MASVLMTAWILFAAMSVGGANAPDHHPSGSSALPPGLDAVAPFSGVVGDNTERRSVRLSAFFIDAAPVTVDAYRACAAAGACPALAFAERSHAPARVDWASAERLCAYAGKRLPSEAEWEVAQETLRPLQPATAQRPEEWTSSNYVAPERCSGPSAPLPRWSAGTWAAAVCGSVDVLDACDGAPFCGSLVDRVVKNPMSPRARRAASGRVAFDGDDHGGLGPRHAFRCASSSATLAASPSVPRMPLPPRPPDPATPTPKELAAFGAIVEDTLDVPVCDAPGRSFADCRDPRSYLKTNEPKIGVVLPYIANLGGGYVGVASDQNYTFVAHARSQWVWLFDYDENVVRWHKVLRALILAAPDRQAFVSFFLADNERAAREALGRFADDKDDPAKLMTLFRAASGHLLSYYRKQQQSRSFSYSWLGSDSSYEYIRSLYQKGRMNAFRGNMLDVHTMKTIGDAARALGIPVRIYYPSNAPEFWPFTEQYRQNVRGLPFDDHSVVVQTISSRSLVTGFGQRGYWHYNVQGGLAHQDRLNLKGFSRHKQLLFHRAPSESPELTLSDLPGGTPTQTRSDAPPRNGDR